MTSLRILLVFAASIACAACADRNREHLVAPPNPTGANTLGAVAEPPDDSLILPTYQIGGYDPELVGPTHRIVQGKVVVKLAPGESLEEFHEIWGTETDVEVEDGTYAQLDLPGEGENPWSYALGMANSTECEAAEPVFWMESPESQQGTVPFFEWNATPETVTDQTALARIGAAAAHAIATGEGVVVAIIDTGIDRTHPDLAGSVLPGGWDFVDEDADPSEETPGADLDEDGAIDEAAGHGTHVAGLVHAVAPGAKLLAVRVLDSEGNGTTVDVARGIRWATANGAHVINLSLGLYAEAGVLREAVQDAVDAGIPVVSAMGNRNLDDPSHLPSRMSEVISVASTNAQDLKAPFSNYGDDVLISSPGVGLISTWLQHGYASWSGTSMSTPLVTGAVALRLELRPLDPPTRIAEALDETGSDLPGGYPWTDEMGGGLLQIVPMLLDDGN